MTSTVPQASSFKSIASILICVGFLVAGNGLFMTLFPLRADAEGFSVVLTGTGIVIGYIDLVEDWAIFAIAVAHGALMVPLYALCLSHANDDAPNSKMAEVSNGLLLAYSTGAQNHRRGFLVARGRYA